MIDREKYKLESSVFKEKFERLNHLKMIEKARIDA